MVGMAAWECTSTRNPPSSFGTGGSVLRERKPSLLTSEDLVETGAIAGQIAAIGAGQPLIFRYGEGERKVLVLRPSAALAEDFALRLGQGGPPATSAARTFTGWAFDSDLAQPYPANLAVVGGQAAGSWLASDGTETTFQWQLGTAEVQLRPGPAGALSGELKEVDHGRRVCLLRAMEKDAVPPGNMPTILGQVTLASAAQGGLEPATGAATLYVNPIPFSESYALSLKEMNLLLAIDRSATGPNDTDHLMRTASRWLATVANVATIFENQLGIRLRLQELILIPDAHEFEDIPSANVLPDFNRWVSLHRPRGRYHWDAAFKVGEGLGANELGLAYIASLGRSDCIGAIRSNTGWATLAHEMGHGLGAHHTLGGMMDAQNVNGGDRNFFTDALDGPVGTTAVREIYEHSASKLQGAAPLRHPQEMPFAKNDFRVLPLDDILRFGPTGNDLRLVRHGKTNRVLGVEELSRVRPAGAGELSHDSNMIEFTPAEGFSGPVWFSYALRGSVGNEGKGWLHKGDVTVLVGEDPPSRSLAFFPGETRTFPIPGARGPLSQPRAAHLSNLADDEDQFLIRVEADASGTDAFTIGDTNYPIIYETGSLLTQPDVYWHHHELGTLRMHPLANDVPSAPGGVAGSPAVSMSPNAVKSPLSPFPRSLHLVQAENLSPDKGNLVVMSEAQVSDGRPSPGPTDELQFTPAPGATGTASLRYTVRDPSGDSAWGQITIHLLGEVHQLVAEDAVGRYFIPKTASHQSTWMLRSFNDRDWPGCSLPIGYEDGRGYEALINTEVGRQMVQVNSSLYLRIPFTVEAKDDITRLFLRMRMDDGFVAYLNGKEVKRENAPEVITWSSRALEGREASQLVQFDLTEARSVLRPGENLLAIQGLNARIDSSDFLVMPELVALSLPKLATIASPAAASISIPTGTGIRFQREVTPRDPALPLRDPITTHWHVSQAPQSGPVEAKVSADGARFHVYFAHSGTYRVRLTARDSAGAKTVEERVVRVGISKPYDQSGGAVDAGADRDLNRYTAELSANFEAVVPGQETSGQWQVVSGPGRVSFDNPRKATTQGTFSQSGHYRLRYLVSHTDLTLFDDVELSILTEERLLIGESSQSAYRYFTEPDFHRDWPHPDFPDEEWMKGGQGLGFDLTGQFDPYIDTNLRHSMQHRHSSVFVRYPFTLENGRTIYRALLTLRADDGCVVYLNGREVYRQHAPLYDLGPASTAVKTADESFLRSPPQVVDLTEYLHLLRPGHNLLAAHGLNHTITNSDFLIQPTLRAHMGKAERSPDGIETRDLVTFALGEGPPEIELRQDEMIIRFARRENLGALGGHIDVETSHDLKSWRLWRHQSSRKISSEAGYDRMELTGPREDGHGFLRLRVSF